MDKHFLSYEIKESVQASTFISVDDKPLYQIDKWTTGATNVIYENYSTYTVYYCKYLGVNIGYNCSEIVTFGFKMALRVSCLH